MRSAIPPMKAFGSSWAADNIESPFLYLPNSIATGTALGTTGVPIVSNITGAPSTFAVVDADSSADNNEGYFTQDATNDNDYIWPGNADYDAVSHGLFQLGNFLPAGTSAGIGGRVLLLAFTVYFAAGATNGGGILSFGRRNGFAGLDGWSIAAVPGAANTLIVGLQLGATVVTGDATNASLTGRDTPIRVAVLFDAKNGEILSAVDGQAVTVAGKSTLLAGMNAQAEAQLLSGFTLGGLNASQVLTVGNRSLATSADARWRDMFIMDMTNYANAQADFYELADRLHRAPAYSLPHWMDRF